MKKLTIKNTQKDRLWDEGTVNVPETLEEFVEVAARVTGLAGPEAEKGIIGLIMHSLPIKARCCKNVEQLQDYVDDIIAGKITRSKSAKSELIDSLSGHMDRSLLRKMSIRQLQALKTALNK